METKTYEKKETQTFKLAEQSLFAFAVIDWFSIDF